MKQNIKIDVEDNKLKELIGEVLQRIPVKLPHLSIYNYNEAVIYNDKGKKIKYKDDTCGEVDESNNIALHNKLFDKGEDFAIGIIAHEFAHAYLKHGYLEQGGLLREMDADLLACKWGFKKEIKKCRIKYIKFHRKGLKKLNKKYPLKFVDKHQDEWFKIIE